MSAKDQLALKQLNVILYKSLQDRGADPEFLDRGFKLAEGGFDLCSLTNFS